MTSWHLTFNRAAEDVPPASTVRGPSTCPREAYQPGRSVWLGPETADHLLHADQREHEDYDLKYVCTCVKQALMLKFHLLFAVSSINFFQGNQGKCLHCVSSSAVWCFLAAGARPLPPPSGVECANSNVISQKAAGGYNVCSEPLQVKQRESAAVRRPITIAAARRLVTQRSPVHVLVGYRWVMVQQLSLPDNQVNFNNPEVLDQLPSITLSEIWENMFCGFLFSVATFPCILLIFNPLYTNLSYDTGSSLLLHFSSYTCVLCLSHGVVSQSQIQLFKF